ncbi:MAG: OB-fold domain-containing protein, partial [Caldilineales bacterium]|nr:OB-fold domain-containing protein [Caldilineales bacterium]
TTVFEAPKGFDAQSPYSLALIKLHEGPMLTAQLTDVEAKDIRIGMPVEMVTRKLSVEGDEGLIQYGYKFRPQMMALAA